MGQLVFILGRSGTGKSYSMRNFPKDKLAVINVQGKILPFKGAAQIESTPTDQSDQIIKALEIYAKDYKSIVIDDYQYTMANEFMRRSAERGFDKFTEIGRHAWDIANKVRELPGDVIVYVLCHTDRDDEGNEKIKTIGKLLDEKICLEGMSTIVLKTNVTDGEYSFFTQNNGKDTVKSPAGMFPSYAIDNDLYYVDQKIRSYYELGEFLTDEDIKEIDEAVKKEDIPIKDEPKKRGRRSAKKEELAETPAEEKKEEKPKRGRKKVSDTLKEEREAVKEENEGIIANANTREDGEPIPFEEAETPELKETPKRKSRKKVDADNKDESDVEREEAPASDEPAEKPKRTRSRKTSADEPAETTESQAAEETSEAPARRRRRRA